MNRLLLVSALVLLANNFIEYTVGSETERNSVISDPNQSNIGDYSNHINGYNKCGLSWYSLGPQTKSSENSHQLSKRLENARDVTVGEAPWKVYIGGCGGALISDQWILTAAHCLGSENKSIYFDVENRGKGYSIDSSQIFKHPLFKSDPANFPEYDIGLIKLSQSIKNDNQVESYFRNFICLPSKNLAINDTMVAWQAGFGPGKDHLKISKLNVKYRQDTRVLYQSSLDQRDLICKGDSGGPIWLYQMGRAYIIGVQSVNFGSVCSFNGISSFVPKHIDWILETMNKH